MRILAVDVGTGTQDILLFDSETELENCVKMVLPSPTLVVAGRIRQATAERRPVVLRGIMMGGGPCSWAASDHLAAGLPVFATPAAAQTFDDDLEQVRASGVQIVSEDECRRVSGAETVEMRDFWLDLILDTLRAFGAPTRIDALAVAVFDHGSAPPGYSDRVFRFEHLARQLGQRNSLTSFAFLRPQIPAQMTRLEAVAASAPIDAPLLVMDTAPAAVLGALEDHQVLSHEHLVVTNVGNFHCLAFRIESGEIVGLFEHHSGELTSQKLRHYVESLAAGTISNQEVFNDMGHGALMLREDSAGEPPFLAVTGPRRRLLVESGLNPYLAVPHGDMMLTGCFGLLRAFAAQDEEIGQAVLERMGPPGSPVAA